MIMIFLVLGILSFSFDSTAVPSMSGKRMSINARLQNLVSDFSITSFPFSAVSTMYLLLQVSLRAVF